MALMGLAAQGAPVTGSNRKVWKLVSSARTRCASAVSAWPSAAILEIGAAGLGMRPVKQREVLQRIGDDAARRVMRIQLAMRRYAFHACR